MNNVAEFGIQLIESLSERFKEKYKDLETKKNHLATHISEEIQKRTNLAQRVGEINDSIERVESEIRVTKANINQMILDGDFDVSKEKFISLRKIYIKKTAEMEQKQFDKVLLTKAESESDERIKQLVKDKEEIESKIPTNQYEEVLAIIENNEQVRKVFSETSRILELLRDVNAELEIDVIPYDYDDIPGFEITMIKINGKIIKTEKTHLRTEVETWNSEVHRTTEFVTPTLDFDTSKEIREVFKLYPKQEISIETVLSSKNEKRIKSIFLKNKRTTKPVTEEYIKIGAKDICVDEDETELDFLGLDISFSEFPYSV